MTRRLLSHLNPLWKRSYRRALRNNDLIHLAVLLSPIRLRRAIHVGAHLAQERRQYDKNGFKRVLWIEAATENYDRVQQVLSPFKHHEVVQALVTDRDGDSVALRKSTNAGASHSIFRGTAAKLERAPHVVETGEQEVLTTCTLDQLAEKANMNADLLTVDVQGAELLVFRGGGRVLSNAAAVISEVSTIRDYEGGAVHAEIVEYLAKCGFKPASKTPRHGDVLFLRS